jgi:hypothetical protein
MWSINFNLLFRLLGASLFRSKNTHYRLTGKRVKVLIIFMVLFVLGMTMAWIGFLFDHIFFPRFRRQKVVKPVFIIGNFRTGSTLLHRIMAQDTNNFCSFKTWEIYAAPSISIRKFVRALLLIDSLVGNPLRRFSSRFEKNTFSPIHLHKMGLREPEEEEGMLLYIWNSFWIRYFFPVKEEFAQFDYFDKLIPASRRRRIMHFYKKCVMRQLYSHNGKKSLLSKNPCFTPKVQSLMETFPDAKFIYLARDPVETCTSKISWFAVWFHSFNSLLEKYPFKDETIELMKLWYSYPVEVLKSLPPSRALFISYDDFVKNPEKTVRTIYRSFGFSMSARFEKILNHETHRAKSFKSSRETTAESIGMSKKELKERFQEIDQYWQFDRLRSSRL